jgi:hypothetical protein
MELEALLPAARTDVDDTVAMTSLLPQTGNTSMALKPQHHVSVASCAEMPGTKAASRALLLGSPMALSSSRKPPPCRTGHSVLRFGSIPWFL